MEIAFLDTSALVKRYHEEEYSDLVNKIFEEYVVVISELSLVEFTSAINKKASDGVISKEEVLKILGFFQQDLSNFTNLRFDTNIINSAIKIVLQYNLKTLDAIQLTFASRVKEYKPLFVSFDENLNKAAEKEGFNVVKYSL